MAYYDDGYMWRPQEHASYDLVYDQNSVSFSCYESQNLDSYDAYTVSEFDEPELRDHYHDHSYDYDYTFARPEINYLAYDYAEPKLIAYEPAACDTGYVSYHTHHSITYSKSGSEFNEPEFEEYDPTPYGGGYDIVSEYGKPLPPSDQTCYPRSTRKPIPEPKSKTVPEPESKPMPKPESKTVPEPVYVPSPIPLIEPEPVGLEEVEEIEKKKEGYGYPDYGYDYPWPEYDHGYGIGVGYDYGYGKQMVQVPPCEYNPEVVDLCENIFGYWPCLARIRKQQTGIGNDPGIAYTGHSYHNPWEGCANYIFGYNHGCQS